MFPEIEQVQTDPSCAYHTSKLSGSMPPSFFSTFVWGMIYLTINTTVWHVRRLFPGNHMHSNKFLVKENLVLCPCGKCLVNFPRKTLSIVYGKTSVVCKKNPCSFNRDFLSQHLHAHGLVYSTGTLWATHRGIPCRCSPRISLLMLAEGFLQN